MATTLPPGPDDQVLMDQAGLRRVISRMAMSMLEEAGPELRLVGIRRGGVPLANRLADAIRESEGARPLVGTVDIALYRDDASTALPDPKIGPSDIPFDIAGKQVVLVDDVLQTGRTVRAAIECVLDYGRPRRIWLASLFDRGGRELPLSADFVGREVTIDPTAKLSVQLGDAADCSGDVARVRVRAQ